MSEIERHSERLQLACRAADAARAPSLAGFRVGIAIENKSGSSADIDPVTEADRNAEAAIRDVLMAGCSDIGFVGEETAASRAPASKDGLAWVVDPIDGTRAYVCGIPLWSTLIALCDSGVPLFGVVDFPALGERYIGADGAARMIRTEQAGMGEGSRLQTRRGSSLESAILCCTTPDMFADPQQRKAFEALRDSVGLTRFGTDAYGYAMLAAGHVDAVVEADLAPWDVAAVAALVRAAGGVITDWDGRESLSSGSVVAAASGSLHQRMLSILEQNL